MSRRKQTGFTLIEILIVAALIALLSGIAAINIQRAYVDNQRKSTYGECRNIATALSFACHDIQVYPKLCFLSQNLYFIAPPQPPNLGQAGPYVVSGFEYIGYEVNQPAVIARRIVKNWAQAQESQGYFAAGSGRRGMFQGRRGGIVKMEIPTDIYQQVVVPNELSIPVYDWPADPWGTPYVVYMLHQEGSLPDGRPNVHFVREITERPNYAFAIVSYGPNRIPGGGSDWTAAQALQGQQLWLFERDTGNYPDQSDFRALRPNEYTPERAEAWSVLLNGGTWVPGVIDDGSDDIIIDIP